MKTYCICASEQTLVAMRFGGIEGVCVTDINMANELVKQLVDSKEYALIMVSETLYSKLNQEIFEVKINHKEVLIMMIPEPEGLQDKDYMMNYIKNSIGLKL